MNKLTLISCVLVATGLLSGCATTSTPVHSVPSSEFATLGDPLEVEWTTWTKSTSSPLPEAFLQSWSAFDYALVQNSGDAEVAWAAVHGVLNLLQTQDTELHAMLMTELEPIGEPVLDLSFVVLSQEPSREGILVRWSGETREGLTPQLSVLMSRSVGEASPSEIVMWLHSAAEQEAGETVTIRREEGWSMSRRPGIDPSVPDQGEKSREAMVAAGVLVDAIWRPFSEINYIEKVGASQKDEVGVEPAHAGLPKADRQISQVLSDTQFPPRFEFR